MVFQCINIRQVPWEVLKTAAFGLGFQHLPRDLANVNAWKTMFNPYSERSLSCMWHAYLSLSMHLRNIIKLFQTIKKLWSAKEFDSDIYSGKFTRKKGTKQELSFLHVRLLYLTWYMSHTKYYQIISHSIGITPAQDFSFRRHTNIMQKLRVVSLARDMLCGPYLCRYQILSIYFKPLRSNWVHKIWLRHLFRRDN